MKTDIVIVNWNSGAQLQACIESIRAHGAGRVGRCIVVDNGSQDGSTDFLAGAEDVDLLETGQNLGFGKACNLGAARGQSPFVLFLNPDAWLQPGSLSVPLDFMARPENDRVGIVGIALTDADGTVQRSCARFPTPPGLVATSLGLKRLFPALGTHMHDWDHATSREVPHVIGAFYLIRRPLFEQLQGFDERFFVYLEDLDLSLRARQAGYRSYFLTEAQACHAGGGVSAQVKAHRLFYSLRSRVQYAFKHFSAPGAWAVAAATLGIEPVTRLGLLLAKRRFDEIGDLGRGYAMLWGWALRAPFGAGQRGAATALRVTILSRYSRMGASSRLRTMQYLPHLERAGVEVTLAPFFDDAYLRALYAGKRDKGGLGRFLWRRLAHCGAARRADVIWVEKEALPWFPWPLERLFLPRGVPVISDHDDAVFHRYDQHRNPLVRRLLGRKIDGVMAHSALVTAGNRYLAERAAAAGAARIEIVPTVVDLDHYRVPAPKPPGSRLVIGWIGTPGTWAKYMEPMRPLLAALAQQHDATILAVGAGEPPGAQGCFDFRAWSEDTEAELICQMDIGLMPLPDTPWERGKCGYKLIQYMACGLPVVASPVGVNRDLVSPGENGFLATTEAEWRAALDRLAADPGLRRRMGAAGRQKVEQGYSLQVWGPRLVEMIRETAGQRR
ncbi:glycosyltransferase [Rhodobacter capsulatus]|jgi:GT2 family glycosyltransferase/glycosyltransferase involved in cell wall biosynthesis|uniref:Glycosyl transferase, family 2/group 1 n=1 Tax=Rhodobacter capsulatus (strain ATCC BAA-309 / NBRC 16581 / SB1003) TaxID=272942 RepID=D5ARH5_RHOCB|nr:glycosyltransferase [Rhodobacter capsulatus]ADE84846.1 glycosyl transferase, family 2/group 1 [Rhodobacter capsulatus SB 1003]MDS0925752.1 glycosyltransferase [Rhodobacter capsulatus]